MYVVGTQHVIYMYPLHVFMEIFLGGLKSTLCGAMQLHSLLSFSLRTLKCENLKKRCVLHVLCIFRLILTPTPLVYFLEHMWVNVQALVYSLQAKM